MAAREVLEAVIRAQIGHVLTHDTTASGIDRAAKEILKAADSYAFNAYRTFHYKGPLGHRSACGRAFGGVTDPLEVTCASCMRSRAFSAALEEVA
jgi:hypothetical protein